MNTPKQNKIGFWVIATILAVMFIAGAIYIYLNAKY